MKHGYLFNASATGLSGRITLPFHHIIESQAPSALGPVGGYSGARVPGFRFKEILSCRAAYTQVIGDYNEPTDSWDTVITSTVEGLQILGVVQAERIVARVATRHYLRPDIILPDSIRPAGSTIEGLTIAGRAPALEWHKDLLFDLDTFDKIADAHEERSEGQKRGDAIAVSLVKSVTFPDDGIESPGHTVYVPQFGTIHLAQYVPSRMGARIDMLRVELGCAVAGDVACGSGATSGQPMPPPHGN